MSYRDDFPGNVRSKGATEVARERVNLTRTSDTLIQAFVQSARVKLTAESIGDVHFSTDCSCEKAKAGEFCKHIWATLLKVEESHPDFLSCKTRAIPPAAQAAPPPRPARPMPAKPPRARPRATLSYPGEVEEALKYFAENGFAFEAPLDLEAVNTAKRKLAKVFHPDRGGSHHEVVSLNANYLILEHYLKA